MVSHLKSVVGAGSVIGVLFAGTVAPVSAQSVETKLLVRAVSRDAKIIGTNVGGAEITVFNTVVATSDAVDGTFAVGGIPTILGDVVANVVGEQADVMVLMPIGADPHDFQASSAQVAKIHGADLVVANGYMTNDDTGDL